MRVADYFDAMADRQPGSVALIEGDREVTYGEARRFVHAVANALDREPGLRRGAHVALYAPNHIRVPLLVLAINRCDAVWLTAHTRNPVDVNAAVLSFMDCEFIFFHSDFEEAVPQLREAMPKIVRFVCIDGESQHGPSLDAWLEGRFEEYPWSREQPMTAAKIQPTGGTTGPSKAVVHSHAALETMIYGGRDVNRFTPSSRYLAVAPLTHAGGITAITLMCCGGSVVVMNSTNSGDILDAIQKYRITNSFLPPTLLYKLIDEMAARPRDVSSLRAFTTGAAPVSPDKVKEAVRLFGPIMCEGYGLTECGMPLIHKHPEDYILPDGGFDEATLAAAGRPTFNARIAIMDDAGRILPPGERGEIVVRGNTCMLEYYKNAEATKEATRFGWWHSGDVGVRDERGFITIVDRMKDMIVTGGFNVYPAQVERVILEHEAVLDCAVVGSPDEKWGEAVTAVVELRPGMSVDAETLIALCKTRLGSVYAPKRIEFWESLPRSAVGKLLRRDVRSRFWAGQWRAV